MRDARADREGRASRLGKATTDRERAGCGRSCDLAASRPVAQRSARRPSSAARSATPPSTWRSAGTAARRGRDDGDRWTPGDALGDAVRVLEVIAGVL